MQVKKRVQKGNKFIHCNTMPFRKLAKAIMWVGVFYKKQQIYVMKTCFQHHFICVSVNMFNLIIIGYHISLHVHHSNLNRPALR